MENKYKSYLGDGVYADFDGYHVVLTTETVLIDTANTIFLDIHVQNALLKYLDKLHAKDTVKSDA